MKEVISQEIIEKFLNGEDDEQYITSIEYDYSNHIIYKIIQDPEKGKIIKTDSFTPFLWCTDLSKFKFYNKDKSKQKEMMLKYGIVITKLRTDNNKSLENGLKFMVKSVKSYNDLMLFFKNGGIDPKEERYKSNFVSLTPVEQFLIQKKKRLFKGIENYDDVHRFVFDIETTGLDPKNNKIILIGVKDNRGFHKTFDAFGENGEKLAIINFFNTIKELKPTIIGGYNSANFDFPFILKRCQILGLDIKKLTSLLVVDKPVKEKEGTLKLASEVEKYTQHVFWGYNTIDIAHSVRRAQAINSEIKKWSLKYITKYLEKEKPNRIYVDGNKISDIYLDDEKYYVNPKSGGYKKVGTKGTENLMFKYPNVYEIWGGKRIVEQYLDDDLYETMVVDDSFSQSTFLISKLVPTTYERVATMGTASLWRLIMIAWSYENNLAIPLNGEKRKFTGGLSRLVRVGYSKNIVKFDFASLYPSIQLVYDIFPESDITGVQKSLLKYFRNVRITYKHLASEYKESNSLLSEMYDRKQLPIKIFINGYFGSLSAPHVFPWGDIDKGEEITCIGRQWLRGLIMFFMAKGYKPLVMDSVEEDTPVFLKEYTNRTNQLVILPISQLFNEKSEFLSPDGLRDFEPKKYKILTKNGWKNINYVYRHETTKDIHKLITKNKLVCCTSDHSVFQNGEQIKPTELIRGSEIDIVPIPKISVNKKHTNEEIDKFVENLFSYEVFPSNLLNGSFDNIRYLINKIKHMENEILEKCSKSFIAGYVFLKEKVGYDFSFDENWYFSNKININEVIENKKQYVYDISTEDGTFVGGIGGILLKNTDGVNLETPPNIEEKEYIGLGNNELVKKDKVYKGIDADVAEFNDLLMRNEMGLDIDYISPVTINISRKNYIIKLIKKGKEKIKLTGNTIKSKKLQQYISEFLDEGLVHLLNGDGLSFIELYYSYISKLYNKEIPLSKIANKSRVKLTLNEYKEYCKRITKAGNSIARQAHMELALANNLNINLGDTLYYINNGTKKGQGDVQKIANEKYSKKEEAEYLIKHGKSIPKTYRIELNCYLIDEKDIIENPDKCGDYNVARYIENFNKRISPLLVVFNPSIRDEIIVDEPSKRNYFTKQQCELVSGYPLEENGQDDLDEILTLSESEIKFWKNVNKDPYLMYLEDSLKYVDEKWVKYNKELLQNEINKEIVHNEDDELFNDNWLEMPINSFIID